MISLNIVSARDHRARSHTLVDYALPLFNLSFLVMGEINLRKRARSAELSAIKEKVITTFEIPEKRSGPVMLPWVERCVLSLRVNDVGIAIPLQDVEIEAPFFGHPLKLDIHGARPAFLVSTPSILFAISKGSAGIASISDLSAQFVASFDQTKARDFSGFHHETKNRLLLPLSGIKISSDAATSSKAKAFSINAKMSGAQLDIDGTVPNSVFALIDLYEISYKRLARHAPESEVADKVTLAGPDSDTGLLADQKDNDIASFFDATTFEATFEVESGVVRMHSRHAVAPKPSTDEVPHQYHSKDASNGPSTKPIPRRRNEHVFSHGPHTARGSSASDSDTFESFIVPKLTMWSVKKDAIIAGKANNLHVDALIHSSRNILRPTLLPFLSEVSEAIKGHMQRQDTQLASKEDESPEQKIADPGTEQLPGRTGMAGVQKSETEPKLSDLRNLCLSISLRIDKSSLQLNCGKVAPVSAGLDWQSGCLMVVLQPGLRSLHASLRIDEVGFDVRHA